MPAFFISAPPQRGCRVAVPPELEGAAPGSPSIKRVRLVRCPQRLKPVSVIDVHHKDINIVFLIFMSILKT